MPPSVSKAQAKCRCEKCHNRMKCKQITPQAAVGGRRLGHKDVFWQKSCPLKKRNQWLVLNQTFGEAVNFFRYNQFEQITFQYSFFFQILQAPWEIVA